MARSRFNERALPTTGDAKRRQKSRAPFTPAGPHSRPGSQTGEAEGGDDHSAGDLFAAEIRQPLHVLGAEAHPAGRRERTAGSAPSSARRLTVKIETESTCAASRVVKSL